MEMHYLLYFFLCAVITAVGTVSGIGGGIVIKPVIDALSDMDVSVTSFLSGCTVLAMSSVSVLRRHVGEKESIDRRTPFVAFGAAAGGVAGKFLFERIQNDGGEGRMIGAVQSAVLFVLTIGVLLYIPHKDNIRTVRVENRIVSAAIGGALGIISAFLGIGGGPINLAVLYVFFSMSTPAAVRSSLYIIFFSQLTSLGTVLLYGRVPPFDAVLLILMATGGILGGWIGCMWAKKMTGTQMDTLLRWLLVLITFISFYNFVRYVFAP